MAMFALATPYAVAANDAGVDAAAYARAFGSLALPQDDAQSPDASPGTDAKRVIAPAAGYRTVCVRLCDGYYWPVSAATSMDHFQRDRTVCESSCQQPARLYFQPAGDTNAQKFVGLDGASYSALPSAFSYRTQLNSACRCKPDPWSESEVERHRQYGSQTTVPLPDEATNSPTQDLPIKDAPTAPPKLEAVAGRQPPVDPELAGAAAINTAFSVLFDSPLPRLRR